MTATRTAVCSIGNILRPPKLRKKTTIPTVLCLTNSVSHQTGGVISIGRTENYCQNSTFTTELKACLECALEYNIWQYYGESVSAAAEGCGLDATPLAAANATTNGTATSTAIGSTTSGAGGATTTAATASGSGSSNSAGASATVTSSGSAGVSISPSPIGRFFSLFQSQDHNQKTITVANFETPLPSRLPVEQALRPLRPLHSLVLVINSSLAAVLPWSQLEPCCSTGCDSQLGNITRAGVSLEGPSL